MYERFLELLNAKGISIAEFSRQTGLSKSTLSDWKNGKFDLSDKKKRIIADYFGVTLDYLDGLTDNPYPYDFESEIQAMENRIRNSNDAPEHIKKMLSEKVNFADALSEYHKYMTTLAKDQYYIDPEVSQMAQELSKRKELQILFDTVRDIDKEDIETVVKMIKGLKNE